MAASNFDSGHELWTEINTLADELDGAANLTALEQARVAQINAKSNWSNGDVHDFCRLLQDCLLRRTGTTD